MQSLIHHNLFFHVRVIAIASFAEQGRRWVKSVSWCRRCVFLLGHLKSFVDWKKKKVHWFVSRNTVTGPRRSKPGDKRVPVTPGVEEKRPEHWFERLGRTTVNLNEKSKKCVHKVDVGSRLRWRKTPLMDPLRCDLNWRPYYDIELTEHKTRKFLRRHVYQDTLLP